MYNLGVCLLNQGDGLRALALFESILQLQPSHPEALYNVAYLRRWVGKIDEAAKIFATLVESNPTWVEARHAYCDTLVMQKHYSEALVQCSVLERQGKADANTYRMRGDLLRLMNDPTGAESEYIKSLRLDAFNVDALHNLGGTLQLAGRGDEAMRVYMREVVIAGKDKRFSDRFDPALSELIRVCRVQCEWARLPFYEEQARARVLKENGAIDPMLSLMMWDDPRALRSAARRAWPTAPRKSSLQPRSRPRDDKVRVGYIWDDFREVAVGRFLPSVLESHDKNRFEAFGYSLAGDVDGVLKQRLESAVGTFRDGRFKSDENVADEIAADQLDVLVDFMGFFAGQSRVGVLAYKPAPVAIHFFPGTLGTKAVDYVVADAHVIPPGNEQYFDEAVLRLPDTYQVCDPNRPTLPGTASRLAVGLKPDAFVFCAFTQPVKLAPQLFDVYMNILKRVPGSQLWLLEPNASVGAKLQREAASRGVDSERLVFAGRPAFEEYLERYKLADLFLDSWPYSSHTTMCDALWAGTPAVTRTGNSFASRIGASILNAAGLPELVTSDASSFEDRAVNLATDPAILAAYKKKLEDARHRVPLFDVPRYTHHWEQALTWVVDRARQGLEPQSHSVPPRAQA
jgi:predicted O-linked N-acetylglucosamine transferase (SPINDLY family)